jgi:hypothetical protein
MFNQPTSDLCYFSLNVLGIRDSCCCFGPKFEADSCRHSRHGQAEVGGPEAAARRRLFRRQAAEELARKDHERKIERTGVNGIKLFRLSHRRQIS